MAEQCEYALPVVVQCLSLAPPPSLCLSLSLSASLLSSLRPFSGGLRLLSRVRRLSLEVHQAGLDLQMRMHSHEATYTRFSMRKLIIKNEATKGNKTDKNSALETQSASNVAQPGCSCAAQP